MDADKENKASWKIMESLGGVMIREYYDGENAHCVVRDYEIEVDSSIRNHETVYEKIIEECR